MKQQRSSLLPVAEARARIVASMVPTPPEIVGLAQAGGRVLARDAVARVTQPPADVSAMDGYAVRAEDLHEVPVQLRLVGAAPAGGSFDGEVGRQDAVRIFTGGPLPRGTDTIVIQENVAVDKDQITIHEPAAKGDYVRRAGLDFRSGECGLVAGTVLSPRSIGLAAAMNLPWLEVRRRPRVALLATGDEIVRPGDPIGPNQIVSSNALAMAAFVRAHGAEPIDLGIALDNRQSLSTMVEGIRGADLLVTMGGASVGDHDLVQAVLGEQGLEVDFWRIAMRPGKPLMFGDLRGVPMIGVPGNPVSSLVCALIFVLPALHAMLGIPDEPRRARRLAALGIDLPANDEREDYLRASISIEPDGRRVATPFPKQDSSMLTLLSQADCLVVRPPLAGPAAVGDTVEIIEIHASSWVL
ncbi:MAG: molybdopterin molybdotransferase MoeA [Proteobacteria bacterium]|nr:molybdopterin molybdotransferase MoeA [Pseudomonadota bacterium]